MSKDFPITENLHSLLIRPQHIGDYIQFLALRARTDDAVQQRRPATQESVHTPTRSHANFRCIQVAQPMRVEDEERVSDLLPRVCATQNPQSLCRSVRRRRLTDILLAPEGLKQVPTSPRFLYFDDLEVGRRQFYPEVLFVVRAKDGLH